jgi:hypothetical protein
MSCSGARYINPAEAQDRELFNKEMESKKATVTLQDGRSYDARSISITADSIMWYSPDGGLFTDPVGHVAEIRYESRMAGGKHGAKYGAATGLLLSALTGVSAAMSGDSGGGGLIKITPLGAFIIAAIIYIPTGALLGLPIGMLVGGSTVYTFM